MVLIKKKKSVSKEQPDGSTDGRTDGWTDGRSEGRQSEAQMETIGNEWVDG